MKPALLDGQLHSADALAGGLCFGLRHGTLLLQLAKIACQEPWNFLTTWLALTRNMANMPGKWRFHHPQLGVEWKLIGSILRWSLNDFEMFGCKSGYHHYSNIVSWKTPDQNLPGLIIECTRWYVLVESSRVFTQL